MEPRLLAWQHYDLLTVLQLPETDSANLDQVFITLVDMSAIHEPGTVDSYLLVILTMMANGSNSHF